MRRVLPIFFALVLMPLYATASVYRCAYDGVTRSACCCPATKTGTEPRHRPAEPAARLRAACCCTITQAASAAPTHRTSQPASVGVDIVPVAVTLDAAAPQPWSRTVVATAHPRAQAPPDTLLLRRCALLL